MNVEAVLFFVFAFCTLASAALVIGARSPIHSAMALVATFFFLAGLYVLLWAHTIAVLQVLVYAGAIMVLFLFVIMLLSLTEAGPPSPLSFSKVAGGLAAAGLMACLSTVFLKLEGRNAPFSPSQQAAFGTLKQVGEKVYTGYLLPFEAVSLLLLVAIVGAVVVAKPKI
jgi:NADH-quinone oxidoreductase subunit J